MFQQASLNLVKLKIRNRFSFVFQNWLFEQALLVAVADHSVKIVELENLVVQSGCGTKLKHEDFAQVGHRGRS